MKRLTTLLLSSLLLTFTVFANPIDPQKANEIATGFWKKTISKSTNSALKLIPRDRMSKAGSRFNTLEQTPGFYLFTPDKGEGFVIVSGDDALPPIIGYSATSKAGEMPAALRDLLNIYDTYVNDVRNGTAKPVQPVTTASNSNIAPMLTTTWDQGSPYNLMCPQVNGSYTPTGCTATASAQIMKFHNWPDKASKSFNWNNNITGNSEYINTSNHKYDWANMLDNYKNGYNNTEANAVALLMSDVGKAMQSEYALGGTGSTPIYAAQALVNIFKYSPDIVIANRSEYTNEEYMELIRTNLEARQPLLYAGHGQNFSSGHAFVCDGINENNLLHINWGWNGAYDGYFDITSMAPGGTGIGGGEERYNVGQAIIANIRPRTNDEKDVNGTPTLWSMYVLNPDTDPKKNEQYEIVDESVKEFKNNSATQRIAFALVNLSHSPTKLQIALIIEKDGVPCYKLLLNDINDLIKLEMNEDSGGHYIINFNVSNTPDAPEGDIYLKTGNYVMRFYYSDGVSDFIPVRGSENDITLEVTNQHTRTYISKPQIKATELTFHSTPTMKGDPISFDAKFKNQNKRNSLVLIAPVLNRRLPDNTYKSDTLHNATAMIEVYDDQEITASFNRIGTFPEDGIYNISFVCNVLNRYANKSMELNYKSIVSIDGKSQDITISPLPDGVVLSTTELNAPAITYGEKASITAKVTNISTSNSTFSGTLGLFAKNNETGKAHLLEKLYVSKLAKGESTEISYKTPDYLPVMQPGNYTISVRMYENSKWVNIRQSAATCIQSIATTNAAIPYVKEIIDINNGNDVVVQGEPFEITATLGCLNADFDGYVRVNIPHGIGYHVRSEYVKTSVKKDGTADITFLCNSKTTTPLGKYRLNIVYCDSNKKKLGDISNNTLTYSGNGYFWVGDNTVIERVEGTDGAAISVCGNYITVASEEGAVTTIYSADGRKLYQGTEETIEVASGLYIVTVQYGNNITTAKVLVK